MFATNACSWGDHGVSSMEGGGGGVLRVGPKFYGVSGNLGRVHVLSVEQMEWGSAGL